MKRTRKLWIPVIALGLLFALPGVASAQETESTTEVRPEQHTVDDIKAQAQEAIDRRLRTLDRLERRTAEHEFMTTAHKAALIADYADAVSGLLELGNEIRAAETKEQLRELVPLISTDYRVYLVIVPKSYEVGASDRVAHVVERFEDVADAIAAAIERAEEAGYDMDEARRWLVSARDEIAEARRTGVPVADDVINLDAADWEDPAKSILDEGHRRLKNAQVDLRQAKVSLDGAEQAIRDAIGG